MSIIRGLIVLSIFLLYFVVIFLSFPPDNIFVWHPVLMSSGFLLTMLNGIRILDVEFFKFLKTKSKRIKFHWIFESLSVGFLFLGFIAIYTNKLLNGKPHFITWHGLLGLLTMIYCIFQLLIGFIFHWNYNLWKNLLTYSTGRFLHAVSGSILYCLISLTFILGFYTNWFKSSTLLIFDSNHGFFVYLCIFVICLSVFSVCWQVVVKYNKFLQSKLSTAGMLVQK